MTEKVYPSDEVVVLQETCRTLQTRMEAAENVLQKVRECAKSTSRGTKWDLDKLNMLLLDEM